MSSEIPSDLALELSPEEHHRLVDLAMERIAAHVASLPEQKMTYGGAEAAADLARSLKEPLPEAGTPFPELLDLLFDKAVPTSFNCASPGYLAYIPGGGLLHAGVADLIANSVNRYVGVWLAAPALVQIETNVVRWFCEIAGYPKESGGFLTTGGSLSTLSAVVVARQELLGEDLLSGTVYCSDQTHHSTLKAAILAGIPQRNVREIPTDETYRIRLDLLAERATEDRRQGLRPFLVVGSAGTVHTGAVDDLAGLADLAERERLWFHVDGAYGGFFLLTERGRKAMAGIERASSIALDPHKSLFLPYGNGALLVRDAAALRRVHSVHTSYLPQMREGDEFVDFCEISPELSRDFRGLRVWLPFKMHGAGPFRRNLDEKLDLARWAADELRTVPGIEVLAEPQLSLLAFRLAPEGLDPARLNDLNARFLAAVNARQRVHITPTTLRGAFALRICVLSFRTHHDRMRMALEDIRAAALEVVETVATGTR